MNLNHSMICPKLFLHTNLRVAQSTITQSMKNDATDTKSLSTSNLINEQKNDPELAILIQQAFDKREISD